MNSIREVLIKAHLRGGSWNHGQQQPSRAARVQVFKSSGSGARREYTCDASPERKTVHVSVRLR
eukprot:1475359-Pleurochrysis_carterae.AAC.1